jgi:NADH-quinone oxidoreductase subunit N
MTLQALGIEVVLVLTGLALLLLDLVTPPERSRGLGLAAAGVVGVLLAYSLSGAYAPAEPLAAFDGRFVLDGLAVFFKRFFLLAALVVLLLSVDYAGQFGVRATEFFALTLFALAGMLFCASANDFTMLFVSLELITVTFYVLTSYQRARTASLEAGVKYLILGGVASAVLVYGIALVFGAAGTMRFTEIAARSAELQHDRLFQLGFLLVFGGLAFKIAVFPFQVWAPDVYEGSPAPATAFLAVGSKAAGVVLLVRLLGGVAPDLALKWEKLLLAVGCVSILYGALCAIPQRSLKRLMGYSSIVNGGFLLLGLAAMSQAGAAAVLYYLAAYLFTVLAAFAVAAVVIQAAGGDDLADFAGLGRRSPLAGAALTLSMVSLAGVPPLAGFIGKFLLLRALVEQGGSPGAYGWALAVAVLGAAIGFYYYFAVIRAVWWPREATTQPALPLTPVAATVCAACIAGMLFLGIYPAPVWEAARRAVAALRLG